MLKSTPNSSLDFSKEFNNALIIYLDSIKKLKDIGENNEKLFKVLLTINSKEEFSILINMCFEIAKKIHPSILYTPNLFKEWAKNNFTEKLEDLKDKNNRAKNKYISYIMAENEEKINNII
ncbi:hypothetical protein KAZ01_04105 [Candidatus Gracilibacteria bacterium]|nr:hypothetical protein [Candidatus Gracilibacteria bacterium]